MDKTIKTFKSSLLMAVDIHPPRPWEDTGNERTGTSESHKSSVLPPTGSARQVCGRAESFLKCSANAVSRRQHVGCKEH